MIIVIAEIGKYGGSKTFLLDLLELISKHETRGIKVFVKSLNDFSDKEYRNFERCGIDVHAIPPYCFTGNKHLNRLGLANCIQFFYFLKLRNLYQPSQMVVSSTQPYHLLSGALLFGANFIYFQHSYPNHKATISKLIVQRIYLGLNNYFFKRPFQFITVSQFAKRKLESDLGLYKSNQKLKVLPNSVEGHLERTSLKKNRNVLTCGSLENYKNPEFWVAVAQEVIKVIPDVNFVWLGDGSMISQMKSKAESIDPDRISFMGYIEEVAPFYEAAWVYFQPSLAESQGISVLEAMSHSIPCVVSDVGGLPESVDDDINGFVINLDIITAAQKLIELLENTDKNLRFGKAARQKALNQFGRAHWGHQVKEILGYKDEKFVDAY